MPSLVELQRSMAAALRAPTLATAELPAQWFTGAIPWSDSLRVHRNTTTGAYCNALRLSYPSVVHAVGEDFFDSLAAEYSRANPPSRPQLDSWGEEFVQVIAAHPALATTRWLPALARFDWRLERLAQVPAMPQRWSAPKPLLAHAVTVNAVQFVASLEVHDTLWHIDELRDAVMADEAERVAELVADQSPRHYALWRAPEGVKVAPLSAATADWLRECGAGAGFTDHVDVAMVKVSDEELVNLLDDILAASFARRVDQ